MALLPALLLAAILFVAALAVTPTGVASPRPGTRVTVALFGDSVTESVLVANFLEKGLVPQLSRAESALGFAPGGIGLIPAVPFRWHFNAWSRPGAGPIRPNGWLLLGNADTPGYDGPSGYSAVTSSPLASATVAVSDPEVEVLYTSTNMPCTFNVSSAGRTWTIDTSRRGPATAAGTALQLPAGRHELTIHGPSCGQLSFDGVVARRPVPSGKVQVEVDDLGHSGQFPDLQFAPRVRESLLDQRYDISVFLYGYIAEAIGPSLSRRYLSSMTARARLARAHGGGCLIVQPTPIAVARSAVSLLSRLDRTVARRAGCTYTTVLAHLWTSAATAQRHRLLFADGIHPSARGYQRIVHALAPIIAQLVRAHVHR